MEQATARPTKKLRPKTGLDSSVVRKFMFLTGLVRPSEFARATGFHINAVTRWKQGERMALTSWQRIIKTPEIADLMERRQILPIRASSDSFHIVDLVSPRIFVCLESYNDFLYRLHTLDIDESGCPRIKTVLIEKRINLELAVRSSEWESVLTNCKETVSL